MKTKNEKFAKFINFCLYKKVGDRYWSEMGAKNKNFLCRELVFDPRLIRPLCQECFKQREKSQI